ncbi:diphthine--ammonia ligase [Leptopilina heterotoma]|uniref:diphthine--ammonia ligase n=1 Tax=Leptopilina heterotoma TaxID=63436 RepID=UPI001CAA176F|nr:diphthine--ammonia ligase [Leptopilina heterotoma]XP_043482321.1 diphthine--ammonia ligase [Leptopilina heterotoma]
MRVVALISGGKDSCFSMMQCVAAGHDIIALANLHPVGKDDLDSFMFQTVGHQGIEFIADAIGLPLYREPTFGRSKMQDKNYVPTDDDEVEDLYRLLKKVKDSENIEAVSSGAIASDYQRLRVENVCKRLGLVSLSYLWQRDQEELLNEMIQCSVNAILIKVACLGLDLKHLGKSLMEMQPHLLKMKEKFGLNVCGEGGEYETFTLDCPLFVKSIVINEYESIVHSNSDIAPVGYLNFKKVQLLVKDKGMENLSLKERLQNIIIKNPLDYVSEILCLKEDEGNLSPDEEKSATAVEVCPREYFDNPSVNENESGWLWFGGLTSENSDPAEAMEDTLNKLQDLLISKSLQFSDIVSVTLFVKDMANYSLINEIYISRFAQLNPPVRVCVECSLKVHVALEATAYKDGSSTKDGSVHQKHTLHVQSISHWAPANVGPYSQVVRIGDIFLVAGQIPLIPGSMAMLSSNIRQECRLTLRHIERLLKSVDNKTQLRDIVQGICFLTDFNYITEARNEWEKLTKNTIDDYIILPNLPRNARIEWSVWAHRDNSRFEYEETRKNMGNIKILLRRRWNYDNISAIVGYLSFDLPSLTDSPTNFTQEELAQCLEYLLTNLKKGSVTENPACTLRIFYKASRFSSEYIKNLLVPFSNQNLVITSVPALYLHNADTYLSVCGIRHE